MNKKTKRLQNDTKGKITELPSLKKLDVNDVKKPWSIISNGKPLSRNVIYIGEIVPDFLIKNYSRLINTLTRPNGTVVDKNIRQKIKKTVVKELLSLGYKLEPRSITMKDSVTDIKGTAVRIKWISGRGNAIIIDRRKSADIDKDTIKIRKYLLDNGIKVDDYNICPTYCVPKKL